MKNNKQVIEPKAFYSIRKMLKHIPWITSTPTLQKYIDYDIEHNENKIFKAIVIQREKQKRYYIKGINILNYIKQTENGKNKN